MLLFNWQTMHLGQDCWTRLLTLRYRCFVERQGYQVPAYQGMEWDSFDTPYTQYGLWSHEGEPRACFRLIPTMERYMIPELWPQLLDCPAPRDPKIWEVSRLGVLDTLSRAERRLALAAIAAGLIEACAALDIHRLVFCSNPKMVRLMFGGVPVEPLGPMGRIDHHRVQCSAISVTPEAIAQTRVRHPQIAVQRLGH